MQDLESVLQVASQPAALGLAVFYLMKKLEAWDKRRDEELRAREKENQEREISTVARIRDMENWQRTALVECVNKSTIAMQECTKAVEENTDTLRSLACAHHTGSTINHKPLQT